MQGTGSVRTSRQIEHSISCRSFPQPSWIEVSRFFSHSGLSPENFMLLITSDRDFAVCGFRFDDAEIFGGLERIIVSGLEVGPGA
jgi:hypothetical protein